MSKQKAIGLNWCAIKAMFKKIANVTMISYIGCLIVSFLFKKIAHACCLVTRYDGSQYIDYEGAFAIIFIGILCMMAITALFSLIFIGTKAILGVIKEWYNREAHACQVARRKENE